MLVTTIKYFGCFTKSDHCPLPSCLGNLTFKESSEKAYVNDVMGLAPTSIRDVYDETMSPPLEGYVYYVGRGDEPITTEEVINFATKSNYYPYRGKILQFMSGIDLFGNNFLRAIPPELGKLNEILALNLSHNNLTGSILATFSNLKHIESLNLSYHNLNGAIPLLGISPHAEQWSRSLL